MKFFILALVLVAAVAVYGLDDDEADWQNFKMQFGKLFLSKGKEAKRRAAFQKNNAKLKQLKAKAETGELTYEPKLYAYHDLEQEEFLARLTGLTPEEDEADVRVVAPTSRQSPPSSFDARTKGWIGAPRDQGSCGSCWTFSTISSIEAAYAKRYGSQIDLSEQHLVDCGKRSRTGVIQDGCQGGWMPSAFNYLRSAGGAVEEYLYKYQALFGTCRSNPARVQVAGYVQVASDTNSIKNAIMQYGSLAIAVDANEWSYYGGGIFRADNVGPINHAVNLIGWGPDYWLIRNSWGPNWGESGNIRVAMTPDGTYYPQYTYGVTLGY